jgi:purine-nucleoside phosphorylase
MPSPVAVVAGSGIELRPLLTRIDEEISFEEISGLSATCVPGHSGVFLRGWMNDIPLVVQCGRRHLYEGCNIDSVGATVDALHDFGVKTVGSLMAVGRVMTWPCRAWTDRPATLPVDIRIDGCQSQGAYMWVPGPSYETRAEIRALRRLGAGAVGMSTAPELFRARQLGIRCAGVSCITNSCLTPQPLTHDHVLAIARAASANLVTLLRKTISQL